MQTRARKRAKYSLLENSSEQPILYVKHEIQTDCYAFTPQIQREFAADYHGGDIVVFLMKNHIIAREDRIYFAQKTAQMRKGEKAYVDFFAKLKKRSGIYHVYRIMLQRIMDETNTPQVRMAIFIDSQAEYQEILKLQEEARLDRLTGIYNEAAFCKRARGMLNEHKNMSYVIARLDIEKFRLINELLGLRRGDRILTTVALALREVAEKEKQYDMCFGRIRADVFALCFPNDTALTERIVDYCCERVNAAYPDYEITLNVGLYVADKLDEPIEMMIDHANLAADLIQGNFLQRYAYYNEKLHENVMNEQNIINSLDEALQEEQFFIVLQPKCRISDGKIFGAEALIRWQHPEHGVIPPDSFIPVLEHTGLIYKLDQYVWEKTCQLLQRQLAEGMEPMPVSVNVSKVDLIQPDLLQILCGLRERYKIPDKLLELEITESANIDSFKLFNHVVRALKDKGFKILLDDFGSAFSTLNVLCNMEINVLKVDMKSILHYNDFSRQENALLKSLVYLSHALDVPIVMEGIETKSQIDMLRELGVEYVQGYYYYKPMPEEAYIKLFCAK